jgi:hypothetical protein
MANLIQNKPRSSQESGQEDESDMDPLTAAHDIVSLDSPAARSSKSRAHQEESSGMHPQQRPQQLPLAASPVHQSELDHVLTAVGVSSKSEAISATSADRRQHQQGVLEEHVQDARILSADTTQVTR